MDAGVVEACSNDGDVDDDQTGGSRIASPLNGCTTAPDTVADGDYSFTTDDNDTAIAAAEQVDVGDGNGNGDVVPTASVAAAVAQSSSLAAASIISSSTKKSFGHRMSNIALPSASFLLQYTRENIPFQLPSTVQGDDTEEKRLFIPVKRHVSAIGPTKVRSYCGMNANHHVVNL